MDYDIFSSANNVSEDLQEWRTVNDVVPLSPFGYYACGLYLVIIGIIAAAGNSTTLIMFSKDKTARIKPMNMLLISLAISDFGISIVGFPIVGAAFFAQQYIWGNVVCILEGWATSLSALVDMFTLVTFALYRWIHVCHPQFSGILDFKFTLKVIGSLWALCFVIVSLPLFGVSRYSLEPFGTSCSVAWSERPLSSVYYTYFLFLFCYVVPVIIMLYCYYRVIVTTKARVAIAKLQQKEGSTNLGDAQGAMETMAEGKVTMVSMVMCVSFLAAWTPRAVVSWHSVHHDVLAPWATVLPCIACKAAAAMNPVIFFLTNPAFKHTFVQAFGKTSKVGSFVDAKIFKINKSKEGVFIGEKTVTMKKARTSMF